MKLLSKTMPRVPGWEFLDFPGHVVSSYMSHNIHSEMIMWQRKLSVNNCGSTHENTYEVRLSISWDVMLERIR